MTKTPMEQTQHLIAKLSTQEKSKLLEQLLIEVYADSGEISPEWIAEIERTEAEMRSGTDPGVSWEAVRDEMRAMLRKN